MNSIIISQILIPIIGVLISSILAFIGYFAKQFYTNHKSMIEVQKQYYIQKVGIDKYNQDVAIVQGAVRTAEQLGKEFNWKGTLKHTKVLSLIEGKTGLTDEEIFDTIKATVSEISKDIKK
jgi:phosphate/sulfate permease